MRRDRFLSLSVAMLAGLLGGVLSTRFFSASPAAADTAKSMTAQSFYLVDRSGTRLADIMGSGNGGSTMTLYDHGGATISLHSTAGVSGVSLFDHNATLRAALEVEHDGTPVLKFYSRDGKLTKQLP
jgi:hypothetical protein